MMVKAIALAASAAAISASAAVNVVPAPADAMETGGEFIVSNATAEALAGITAFTEDASVPDEGYRLSVTSNGIAVAASGAAGRFYALETLRQLARTFESGVAVPCVEISDAPRYPWRGVHFDDCRHFLGKETLKRTLDIMAMHKLNRLHWHLTDDQGWRLDVPGYPELVRYGAVRSASVRRGEWAARGSKEDADKLDGEKYGPFFYTEEDIREIVAYAAARHIQIVPEIELPGHVYAALAAYPQFACFPENISPREPRLVWGIEKDVLCIGSDEAVRFMENVLDWVCRVFPGDVVHIGGDECPQVRWKTCPRCRERIRKEGLRDERGLQPWITARMVRFLEARGKRAIGWDEYLLGDIPASAIGMSWREGRGGAGHEHVSAARAAEAGHDVVMTPCSYCYLDYAQGLGGDTYQYIGGRVTLERCYSFDPCAGIPEEARGRILGGQGNNWTEYTWNGAELEWKMWPRTAALAEVFWLGERKPGFDDFLRRAGIDRARLVSQGVNCAPLR